MLFRRFLGAVLATAACLSAQSGPWLTQVRTLAQQQRVEEARNLVETHRPANSMTATAEWLAGVSWLARGASFAQQWDLAEKYAMEALNGSQAMLKQRSLDADANLPTALGASIEVLGNTYAARGDRASAVEFLRGQHALYRGTSIETRLQKNILLLSLENKPMPVLEATNYLGRKPRTMEDLKGNVVLFFFWAHWCSDCKRQEPILEALYQQYADRGFVVVGPTRLWGYIAGGQDATPALEMDYLRNAYQQSYPVPEWMDVPISTRNFLDFGVSTTPTLVLVDRQGIVRLYHPGDTSYEALAAHIERLLR